MLGLFKAKNPYVQPARQVYAAILSHIRQPKFYKDYGVPDTFDGRFDLMLLHIFMILHRMLEDGQVEAEAFNQALFDVTFADMDQTLREMGIGDMGVPKHQRKMMKAFNGRMHAYEAALAQGTLKDALRKNLYGTLENPDEQQISKMVETVERRLKFLKTMQSADILNGHIGFEG